MPSLRRFFRIIVIWNYSPSSLLNKALSILERLNSPVLKWRARDVLVVVEISRGLFECGSGMFSMSALLILITDETGDAERA
jgi:hypothetical protein